MNMRKTSLGFLRAAPLAAATAVLLVWAGPSPAVAQASPADVRRADERGGDSKQNADKQNDDGHRPGRGSGGGGGPGRPGGSRPWDRLEVSEEEWQRAAAFWQEHSPQRWNMFQQERDEGRQKWVKWFVVWQYRSAEELRAKAPQLYELRKQRIGLEDKIFVASLGVKGPRADDAERERRRAELKDLVRQLVELDLKERRARVERLRRELDREREGLARREHAIGIDQLVDREFDEVLKRAEGYQRMRGNGGNREDGKGGGRDEGRDGDRGGANERRGSDRPRGESERGCLHGCDDEARVSRGRWLIARAG